MAQDNLPARAEPDRIGGPSDPTVRAGSWWKLVGPDPFPGKRIQDGALPPEDPLTLLVEQVRVHDGEVHSVHLANHPAWGNGTVRMLADEFLAAFAEIPAAEAEARREREIDSLMGRTREIAALMSAGPRPEERAEIASGIEEAERRKAEVEEARRLREEARREAGKRARAENLPMMERERLEREAWRSVPDRVAPAAETGGLVPAALLPSGDVLAAQERIRSEIVSMQATQKWISDRAGEMSATMRAVSAYQSEKVAAMTSSISDRTQRAKDMLARVQTMKLFLGDDVRTWPVSEGESAPAEAPLHLMQGMLYLDEEILVEGMFGEGFRHSDLKDLPSLLESNPALVERMIPHPRGVAIARVRRESVQIDVPEGLPFAQAYRSVMRQVSEQDADKRILVLIRDGGNVRVVIADEQTSHAERLFPSRAEIDGIYAHNGREVSPQDIEYSDRRNAHDARALFYKRFLIMLWGLHEREGAFGPFMPKGENWLRESVASERFVFVHDEENVLTDGREPVLEWLERGHDDLRPGSEVLVDTRMAMTRDFAPTAWKAEGDGRADRVRKPTDGFLRATVARSGDALVVQVPTVLDSWRSERAMNTPLIVRSAEGLTPDGVLNLGVATPGTLRAYMSSRLARRSYLSWFGLFHAALPLLDARRAEELPALRRVMEGGVGEEPAQRSLALFRETVKGGRAPGTDAEFARVIINARSVEDPGRFDRDDVVGVRMHASGKLTRLLAAPPRAGAVPVRELIAERDGARELVPFSAINPRGESLILGAGRLRDLANRIDRMSVPGASSFKDWEALEGIDPADAIAALTASMSETRAETEADAFLRTNLSSGARRLIFPSVTLPLGAIVIPSRENADRSFPGRAYVTRTVGAAVLYGRRTDSLALAVASGHEEAVRERVARVASRPDAVMEGLRKASPVRMIRVILGRDAGAAETLRRFGEDGEELAWTECLPAERRVDAFSGKTVIPEISDDPVAELLLRSGDYLSRRLEAHEARDDLVLFGEEGLVAAGERLIAARKPAAEGGAPAP